MTRLTMTEVIAINASIALNDRLSARWGLRPMRKWSRLVLYWACLQEKAETGEVRV